MRASPPSLWKGFFLFSAWLKKEKEFLWARCGSDKWSWGCRAHSLWWKTQKHLLLILLWKKKKSTLRFIWWWWKISNRSLSSHARASSQNILLSPPAASRGESFFYSHAPTNFVQQPKLNQLCLQLQMHIAL